MTDFKEPLGQFFANLRKALDKGAVPSEQSLAAFVQVESDEQLALWKARGIRKTRRNATLLEILGYRSADVEDHPAKKVLGTLTYSPDYILKQSHRLLAALDLKAPETSIDQARWTAQIISYCKELKVPLGILFSGRAIRVFINPEIKGLGRYRTLFSDQPVASANDPNLRQMIEIVNRLSAASLQSDPLVVARSFAVKRAKELRSKLRQSEITELLRGLLSIPPKELLISMASLEGLWGDVQPRPSPSEVVRAWNTLSASRDSRATPGQSQPRRSRP